MKALTSRSLSSLFKITAELFCQCWWWWGCCFCLDIISLRWVTFKGWCWRRFFLGFFLKLLFGMNSELASISLLRIWLFVVQFGFNFGQFLKDLFHVGEDFAWFLSWNFLTCDVQDLCLILRCVCEVVFCRLFYTFFMCHFWNVIFSCITENT